MTDSSKCAQNEKCICLATFFSDLRRYLCCLCSCSFFIMMVSFEASLKWQAGIQILNAVRCLCRTWPRPLAWSGSSSPLLWGYVKNKDKRSTCCQHWWLKTANCVVYWSDPWGNATTFYDIFSIPTVGVYWTTRWSSKMCHVQTLKINMNFQGHWLYLPPLLKIFHFALKRYFTSKTIRRFCLTLYFIALEILQPHNNSLFLGFWLCRKSNWKCYSMFRVPRLVCKLSTFCFQPLLEGRRANVTGR